MVAIEVSYLFIITAGTFTTFSTWNTNYDLIAEGFRSGHLYIPVAPPPELLARPNPFDWSNSNLWFLDASLYKGHYYLYWAPLPALILLAVKVVLRIKDVIGDQYVVFASYTLILIGGALVITRMTRRLFPDLPSGLSLLGLAALAYTSPTTFLLATPGIYQAAIAAAQALLLLGLIFGFDTVWAASEAPPVRWRMLVAGACWAGAIACRVSAVLPAGVFVLLTAFFSSTTRGQQRWRRVAASACWIGGPVAVTLALLGAYNKARFDSWFEVGVKYQLNVFPFVTSRAYLPLNIFSYLLRPVGSSCRFPFVSALYDIGQHGFRSHTVLPPGYSTHEPQAGLFVTTPWTWLVFVALFFAGRGVVRWWRSPDRSVLVDQRRRTEIWCVASLAALTLLMPVVFIAAFGTTMRYVGDFSTGATLLGVWGGWSLLRAARDRWPRRAVLGLLFTLAAATVIIGLLLGVEGYDGMFKYHNHDLYESLRRRLSFCA
jgi:hypothetical protein